MLNAIECLLNILKSKKRIPRKHNPPPPRPQPQLVPQHVPHTTKLVLTIQVVHQFFHVFLVELLLPGLLQELHTAVAGGFDAAAQGAHDGTGFVQRKHDDGGVLAACQNEEASAKSSQHWTMHDKHQKCTPAKPVPRPQVRSLEKWIGLRRSKVFTVASSTTTIVNTYRSFCWCHR